MNPITDKFLAENPGADAIEAVWEQGRSNPEYLKDTSFAADYQVVSEWKKSQLGAADYAKQVVGSGVRGAADTIASLPEGIAIGGAALKRSTGVDLGGADDPKDSPLWKLGEHIRGAAKAVTPDEVDALKDSFWATTVPQGIGSAAGFMAGGGVGRVIVGRGVAKLAAAGVARGMTEAAAKEWAADAFVSKVAQGIPIAGLGAAAQGAGAYKEAKAMGADADAAGATFWLNALGGTSEVIPMAGWLDRLNRASRGTLAKAILASGKETIEEALQEGLQQVGQNYVAQKYYDNDRTLLKDVGENAAAGGVVGALFSTLTQAISHARVRPPAAPGASTPAAKPEAPVINPTAVYKLPEEEKAKLTALAAATVAGDNSSEHHVQVGQLAGGINEALGGERYSFYRQEENRLKAEAAPAAVQSSDDDLAAGIVSEANAAFAKRQSELANEERVQGVQADMQSAVGEALDQTLPPSQPDEKTKATNASEQTDGGNLTEAEKWVIPTPPHPLDGKLVKLQAMSGDGSIVESEEDASEAWKDSHQRKRVYEGLLDCLLGK